MAKFTKVGYMSRRKNDNNKFTCTLEVAVPAKSKILVEKKPSDAEVQANPKLAKLIENWPEWKYANLVLIENDSE